ncbi:MAG TPA: carbon starvation CstA family protein, partial [Anaerolineales bacterium]|nr:carbon starvation CstA family protein [Anaerolineales bacterium]
KMDLITVTAIVVVITLAAMLLGPFGQTRDADGKLVQGPVGRAVAGLNNAINKLSGDQGLFSVVDPTNADPRIPAPGADGKRASTAVYNADTGAISTMPSYLFWTLFLFVFSYLGANLPIWRFAQPVNYIGFWITLITILLSGVGAILAPITGITDASGAAIGAFALDSVKTLGFTFEAGKTWFPIWPMLFITIACGAISGWHALFGSVGTARQLEYETDALPVGGGAMFSENTLALLSLIAVSIAGSGGGGGRFAAGVGKLLYAATFGSLPEAFGTALGFGAFVVIVLTVVQLVFRVMRVTLTEWVGEMAPAVKNMHVSSVISMILTLLLVLTGTWVYLWFLFGAANQLMAALSLLLVTVWLKSEKRNPAFALYPMLFMYITTVAATAVTGYNLWATVLTKPVGAIPQIGAWLMIFVALLLIVAALFIGYDGWQAYQRYAKGEAPRAAPAPTGD